MVTIQRETTEYLYIGVTGDVPAVGAEVAFLAAGIRPTDPDWFDALLVEDAQDPLWTDATGSGSTGDFFVAILVGSFGGNPADPGQGDFVVWLRLTDTVERPVRIAPEALEIL